jgi:hypothetical protein
MFWFQQLSSDIDVIRSLGDAQALWRITSEALLQASISPKEALPAERLSGSTDPFSAY